MSLVNDIYIIGNNKVGSVIVATLLNQSDLSGVTFQWYRSSLYDGNYEIIDREVNQSYVIRINDAYLKCGVTIDGILYYSNVLVVDHIDIVSSNEGSNAQLSNVGRGLSYNNLISGVSGSSNIVYDVARINQSIQIILDTALGEVPMIPTLGCRLHELLFNEVTDNITDEVELEVESALSSQEPRINVINVNAEYDEWYTIKVTIDYTIRNTNIQSQYIYSSSAEEESE